ncbi:hypothetical protein [Bradyrhizobium cajani]|uniref:Uncharacterized protein n=1 Tax=Bradyrhizobium cajani TaxID=1928661 RepID=A0A844TMV0_9BRAD|nr:hypothetical protein [Bradyrhizobium cajani]MCP3370775.1 hypothetical protein [Bradyrhizobium cajani]MVT75880.1 hypothetical protein [Bradyrhizobium cajani]
MTTTSHNEVARYRVTTDLNPPRRPRHRLEPPFSSTTDNSMWQYADRPVRAGEVIESMHWPHPTMIGLNDAARAVLEFYKTRQKSRLPVSPYVGGRLRLSDGLEGAVPEEQLMARRAEPAVAFPVRVVAGR